MNRAKKKKSSTNSISSPFDLTAGISLQITDIDIVATQKIIINSCAKWQTTRRFQWRANGADNENKSQVNFQAIK